MSETARQDDHSEPAVPPSKGVVRVVLADLAARRITPQEAEKWAESYLLDARFEMVTFLEAAWDAIDALSGAAVQVAPGEFLYGQDDFKAWLQDFDDAVSRQPEA